MNAYHASSRALDDVIETVLQISRTNMNWSYFPITLKENGQIRAQHSITLIFFSVVGTIQFYIPTLLMFRYPHTWLLRRISERSLADVIRAVSLESLRDASMHWPIPRRHRTRNLNAPPFASTRREQSASCSAKLYDAQFRNVSDGSHSHPPRPLAKMAKYGKRARVKVIECQNDWNPGCEHCACLSSGVDRKTLFQKVQCVYVPKAALWYQKTVIQNLSSSCECKDGRRFVSALERLQGRLKNKLFNFLSLWSQKDSPGCEDSKSGVRIEI